MPVNGSFAPKPAIASTRRTRRLPPQAEVTLLDSGALSDRPPSDSVGLQSSRDLLSYRSGQHELLRGLPPGQAKDGANDANRIT
ncbi:hypothetical protein V1289_001959 [Bradyrhizobium sp. AZCC 2289]